MLKSVVFPADNVELGTACGKLHRVSVLAITDPGASPCMRTHPICCAANRPSCTHVLKSGTLLLSRVACAAGDSDIIKATPAE